MEVPGLGRVTKGPRKVVVVCQGLVQGSRKARRKGIQESSQGGSKSYFILSPSPLTSISKGLKKEPTSRRTQEIVVC